MAADTPTDVTVTLTTLPNPMIPPADDSLQGRCECAAARRQHSPTRPSRRALSSRQSRTLGEARATNTTTSTADITVVMTAVVAEGAMMIGPRILLQIVQIRHMEFSVMVQGSAEAKVARRTLMRRIGRCS